MLVRYVYVALHQPAAVCFYALTRPQSGTCVRNGAAGTLLEIEELAEGLQDFGNVRIFSSGCHGNCDAGPSVILVRSGEEMLFSHVDGLESAASILELASGSP
jgi:hypothetical protein